jgi:predicted dehydrogenase
MPRKTRVALIGVGGMARHHIRQMLTMLDSTQISVLCEPSQTMVDEAETIFRAAGLKAPPNQPDLQLLLKENAHQLDAAFIISPHVYHYGQARDCMRAGLDVLLEKPMVMNGAEAESLIQLRDETKRLLVVAFPGSLSPQIRTAVKLLRSGQLGALQSISATVWQGWGPGTENTWRQQPAISGGGFLFDTGAHMLNTVVDLAGEEFIEVAAWLDNNGRPVETEGVVIGRLASGALVTLHGSGEAIPSCASDVRLFCSKAILRTGIWGERLELQRAGEDDLSPVAVNPSMGVWEQFLAVRSGHIENPCPPEVGLRMARLYDAILSSSAAGGMPVKCHVEMH